MATAKVIFNGTTLMDITDTSAVAADVAEDKIFYNVAGVKTTGTATGGSTASIVIEDTLDSAGGTIRTITTEGAQYRYDDIAQALYPTGAIVLSSTVTSIAEHAFAGKSITSITAPGATSIGTYSLQNTSITSITDQNFPVLGVSSQYIVFLRVGDTLQSIKLTGEKISLSSGSGALRGNNNLISAEFPNAAVNVGLSYNAVGAAAFYGDANLEIVDLGQVNSFGNTAFYGCAKLNTLILRKTSICSLGNTNAFTGTPFASGGTGGTIYIPKDLYDHLGDGTSSDYKAATNWSTIDGYGTITWAKIEGSQYELAGTGGSE